MQSYFQTPMQQYNGFSNGLLGLVSPNNTPVPTSNGGFNGYCIFIYNIPPTADEQFLYQTFAQFGTVTSTHVMRDQQRRSKGYGFANMPNIYEAQRAVAMLNGKNFYGKILQVSFKNN